MRKKFKTGERVKISIACGVDGGKKGYIIDKRKIRTSGRGIPLLPGHYKSVDWRKESAIELDNGEIITMFNVCLRKLSE